jgi:hypothetical protein
MTTAAELAERIKVMVRDMVDNYYEWENNTEEAQTLLAAIDELAAMAAGRQQ